MEKERLGRDRSEQFDSRQTTIPARPIFLKQENAWDSAKLRTVGTNCGRRVERGRRARVHGLCGTCQFSDGIGPSVFGEDGPLAEMAQRQLHGIKQMTIGFC